MSEKKKDLLALIKAADLHTSKHGAVDTLAAVMSALSYRFELSGEKHPDFMSATYSAVVSMSAGLRADELHEAINVAQMTKPKTTLSAIK